MRPRRVPPYAVGSVSGPTVVEQLDDRAGPAVGHDQRQRVLVPRLDVDEVDVDPVDLRRELGQRVQPRLRSGRSRTRSPSSSRAPASSPAARPASGLRRAPWWASASQRCAGAGRRSSSRGMSIWNGRISVRVATAVLTRSSISSDDGPDIASVVRSSALLEISTTIEPHGLRVVDRTNVSADTFVSARRRRRARSPASPRQPATRYQGLIDEFGAWRADCDETRTSKRHHGDRTHSCIDLDERERAEEALVASERSLELVIDALPALVWSAGPDGSADFFNQHYLDFIGLAWDEASGCGWTAAVHPEDLTELAATWERIVASAAPGEAEARLRRHDGEYRWFLFRASPLRDADGAIVKWYGVNTDIEDRKRGEVELEAGVRQLRRRPAPEQDGQLHRRHRRRRPHLVRGAVPHLRDRPGDEDLCPDGARRDPPRRPGSVRFRLRSVTRAAWTSTRSSASCPPAAT